MLTHQSGEPLVDLFPCLAGHDRLEWSAGKLDGKLHRAAVSFVHDRAFGLPVGGDVLRTHEKPCYVVDWLLRRRQSDALQRLPCNVLQALEGEREVRATTRAEYGVNLVDDHRAHRAQHLPAPLRRQE